jgi:uncharacterized membrane protein
MIFVTKIAMQSFKIKVSFKSVVAIIVQNVMTAFGWVVLVALIKTYALAACINAAYFITKELLFTKAYQKQTTSAMIGTLTIAWLFWPQYLGFNLFSSFHTKEFDAVRTAAQSGSDE